MARNFNGGSTQWLSRAAAIVAAYPFTMSMWYRSTTLPTAGQYHTLWSENDGSTQQKWQLLLNGDDAGKLKLETRNAATWPTCTATNAPTVNVWTHACIVATSATLRNVISAGVWASRGIDTVSVTPTGLSQEEIGINAGGAGFLGDLAEFAVWDIALSQAEVEALAARESPMRIQPADLICYRPLNGLLSPEPDIIAAADMTLTGSPAFATHPPIKSDPPARGFHNYLLAM